MHYAILTGKSYDKRMILPANFRYLICVLIGVLHERQLVHILPGMLKQLVCRNSIATLIGIGKKAWYRIKDILRDFKSMDPGLKGRISNNVDATGQGLLQAFFEDISMFALPRATRVVRQFVVGAKDEAKAKDDGSDSDDDDHVIKSLRETDIDVVICRLHSQSEACTSVFWKTILDGLSSGVLLAECCLSPLSQVWNKLSQFLLGGASSLIGMKTNQK